MENQEFMVVPKLLGLLVDRATGEIGGLIEATALLGGEQTALLSQVMANALAAAQSAAWLEDQRSRLEKTFLLPASAKGDASSDATRDQDTPGS